MDALGSLVVGLVVGLGLATIGVAVPAPPTISGVAGILGMTLGFMVVRWIKS
jgi:XapX domain-containing protein